MCGLTSIGTEQYELIMRWWGSNLQSCISQVLYHAAYCYVNLPDRPCYSNLRCSYHTISSIHLVIPPSPSQNIRLPHKFICPPGRIPYPSQNSNLQTFHITSLRLVLQATLSKFPLPLRLLQNFCPGGPMLFLCSLLAPPSLPPVPNLFVALLLCTYFK